MASEEKSVIPRYTRAEMGAVWSEQNRFQKWLEVELAATETLSEAGIVPSRRGGKAPDKSEDRRRAHSGA